MASKLVLMCGVVAQAATGGLRGSSGNNTTEPDAEGRVVSTNATAVNVSSWLDAINVVALGASTKLSSKGEIELGSLTADQLEALHAHTSVLAASGWDMGRCASYPWELHCLDPSRVCPYMPWMPQCRTTATTPAPTPAPTPVPTTREPTPTQGPNPGGAPTGQIGAVMTLYHQTSPEIAALILNGGFKPGSAGWCGGGIYFAVTPGATYAKAIGPDSHTGFIIEATVKVGKVLHLPETCDRSMTGQKLASQGYDSVAFNPGDGDEYIIYSNDQVISMKEYSK